MNRKKLDLKMPDDKEDAAITAAASSDPDNQPLSEELLAKMRSAHKVVPDIVERHTKRGRPAGSNKTRVTLRLDNDILETVKGSNEKGWQTRVNTQLRVSLNLDSDQDISQGHYNKRNAVTGRFDSTSTNDKLPKKGGRNPNKKSA